MNVELSKEQRRAVNGFAYIVDGRRKRVTLGGYAGTGKTTVIKAIMERWGDLDLIVCAPTGKAAHVLRSKGVEAQTMHSMIYTPRETAKGIEFDLKGRGKGHSRLAIVDEASMLSARLVNDFEQKVDRVMYVGDHGQLEPIGDDPGLMRKPDIRLETIHRQAGGSPIIQFAHHVRRGGEPEDFEGNIKMQVGGSNDVADFDVVLVGRNATRRKINAWVRKRRGFKGRLPMVGETVICLQNDKKRQVWNGMSGKVLIVRELNGGRVNMDVETDDGERVFLPVDPEQFGLETKKPYKKNGPTLWDFGYALTVHKAQGSEWDRVAVYDEVCSAWSEDRWRYTAATRAAKELRWILKR